MKRINRHPFHVCWSIFLICTFTRIIEYFYIRTDETILAENVFHKLFGIGHVIFQNRGKKVVKSNKRYVLLQKQ